MQTSAQRPNGRWQALLERQMGQSAFSRLIAYELSMYVHAFTRAPPRECPGPCYRDRGESSWRQLVWVLLILSVIEGAVVHLLLSQWSTVAAWALTAMQVYGVIWLLADIEALRRYAICAGPENLELRLGSRVRGCIAWSDVESIEEIDKDVDGALRCYLTGSPNLLLTLKEPRTVTVALGLQRSTRRILLALEDRDQFVEMVRRRLLGPTTAADRHSPLAGKVRPARDIA